MATFSSFLLKMAAMLSRKDAEGRAAAGRAATGEPAASQKPAVVPSEIDRPKVRTTRMGSQFVKPSEIVNTKVGQLAIQELVNAGLVDDKKVDDKK